MIHAKSLHRVALGILDIVVGFLLLGISVSIHDGMPVYAVTGFVYFLLGSRVLTFMRLRGHLFLLGGLTIASVFSLQAVDLSMAQELLVFLVVALPFVPNAVYGGLIGRRRA